MMSAAAFRFVWNLFSVRKPAVVSLDFCEVIIEEQAYIIVTWDTVRAAYVTLQGAGTISRNSTGSGYFKITNSNEVVICFHSLFKKRCVRLPLTGMAGDRKINYRCSLQLPMASIPKENIRLLTSKALSIQRITAVLSDPRLPLLLPHFDDYPKTNL